MSPERNKILSFPTGEEIVPVINTLDTTRRPIPIRDGVIVEDLEPPKIQPLDKYPYQLGFYISRTEEEIVPVIHTLDTKRRPIPIRDGVIVEDLEPPKIQPLDKYPYQLGFYISRIARVTSCVRHYFCFR